MLYWDRFALVFWGPADDQLQEKASCAGAAIMGLLCFGYRMGSHVVRAS